MRRIPCRRYKHQDSAHELAMSPLNLSKILCMAVNPLASHPDGSGAKFVRTGCVYRKPKSGRSDDEVRRGLRVI